jgi:hypothetical protein
VRETEKLQVPEMSYEEAMALAARGGGGRKYVWTERGYVRVDQWDPPQKFPEPEMSYAEAMALKAAGELKGSVLTDQGHVTIDRDQAVSSTAAGMQAAAKRWLEDEAKKGKGKRHGGR